MKTFVAFLLLPVALAVIVALYFGNCVFVHIENDFAALRRAAETTRPLWYTYERLESIAPRAWHQPTNAREIVDTIRLVARQDDDKETSKIRVVGAGHSWSPLGLTAGHLINLDKYSRVLEIDVKNARVTTQSGIRLRDLNRALFERGLALENIGSIDAQSLAGAISTSTHGSGVKYGSISTKVLWLEMILANGSTINITRDDTGLYGAATTGLGLLGVISVVQLECARAFHVYREESLEHVDVAMEKWSERVNAIDHYSTWWIPYTSSVRLVKVTRVGRERRANKSDAFTTRSSFGVAVQLGWWLGSLAPRLVPHVMAYYVRPLFGIDVAFVATALDGLQLDPPHVHNEMEYFVDLENYTRCFRDLVAFVRASDEFKTNFIVQTRFSASDRVWLSPMYERPKAAIAIMMYRQDARAFFDGAERIFQSYDGRPHWAKKHSASRDYLQRVYPMFREFLRVREALDPRGIFLNEYLEGVLYG